MWHLSFSCSPQAGRWKGVPVPSQGRGECVPPRPRHKTSSFYTHADAKACVAYWNVIGWYILWCSNTHNKISAFRCWLQRNRWQNWKCRNGPKHLWRKMNVFVFIYLFMVLDALNWSILLGCLSNLIKVCFIFSLSLSLSSCLCLWISLCPGWDEFLDSGDPLLHAGEHRWRSFSGAASDAGHDDAPYVPQRGRGRRRDHAQQRGQGKRQRETL